MRPLRFWFFASALCATMLTDAAFAQQPTTYPAPLLKSVFPPGGRAGTTVEVTVEGADLDGATDLYFSAPGLKAERIPDPPADPKKKAPAPPAKFKVTVPAGAPVGIHDVRVIGKWGISNPRAFAVGELPEVAEKEPNSDVPQAQPVELGCVANGAIGDRTDVDYFAFAGKKGQRVVVHCAASSIDSRLTAHLQLFGPDGRALGSNHFYRDRDALVSAELPADGDYQVRVCDFAYLGGGAEYPYRLTISTGPWLDAAFPPAVPAGKATPVTLYGRNLPGGEPDPACPGRQKLTVTVNAPAAPAPFPGRLLPRAGTVDGFAYRLPGSNPLFLTLTDGPAVLDNGNNDTPEQAQPVAVPCDVCGRFEKRGDRDYYSFEAKKGETVVIEGFADRVRSTNDLYFFIFRARDGQTVGEFDTHPDVPTTVDRFFTHTDDPLAKFTAPEDGAYHLVVRARDAATGTEPRDVYRVSLRRERPDFRLVLVGNHDNGAGFTLHRGSSQAVQVVCFRQDGFDGEVTLSAEGLPPGVTCEPQVVGPKVQQAAIVLTASAGAKDWAGEFRVTGSATVDGKKLTRAAHSGCLVFPSGNNAAAVSRLSRSQCLAVRDPGPFRLTADQKELAAPVGGAATVKVKVDAQKADMKDAVSVTLFVGPAQQNGRPLNVGAVNVTPNKDGTLRLALPANTPPGRYTLVFRGSGKYALDGADKKKRNTQYAAVSAPVALTVFNSACELALAPASVSVRPGGEAAVAVTVKRLHGYNGPLTLELVAPQGSSGVSAAQVTVPAGASQAKLVLKVAANAKPAADLAFLIRATAKIDNSTLREESKLSVTVGDAAPKPDSPKQGTKAEALLPDGAAGWRYAAEIKGDDWLKPDFDDKAWKEVKAPLGNGEAEVATRKGTELPEKGKAVYCRRAFDAPAELLKQKGATFRLKVASDNSAVVYLNGKVLDEDSGDHEFSYWNRDVVIPVERLKPGRNVIAVRVENTAGSSDLYLDLSVIAEVPGAGPGK
jgi:hypothetical protein